LEAFQSSWKKYSKMWARGRILFSCRSIWKVSTWPRRKLAMELPVLVTPCWLVPVVVKAKEPVGLGGDTVLSWYQRKSIPALKAWAPWVKTAVLTSCQTAV
jgi:hypothetical protein